MLYLRKDYHQRWHPLVNPVQYPRDFLTLTGLFLQLLVFSHN